MVSKDEGNELSNQSELEEKKRKRPLTARQRAAAEKKGINGNLASQTRTEDDKPSAGKRRTIRARTGESKDHQDSEVKKENGSIRVSMIDCFRCTMDCY